MTNRLPSLLMIGLTCGYGLGCGDDLNVGENSGGQGGSAVGGNGAGGTTGGASSCTNNATCGAVNAGLPGLCVDGSCVSLLNENCFRVIGDWEDDDAIVWGAIVPAADGTAADALNLASTELANIAVGIPTADGDRAPAVFVVCGDDDASAAAAFLQNTVGVNAMIGPANEADALQVATEETIAGGTLLLLPQASGAALSTLADNGLVWQLNPGDDTRLQAIAGTFASVESAAIGAGATPPLRVALANSQDSESAAAASQVEATLTFNGSSAINNLANGDYVRIEYPDPNTQNVDWAVVASDIAAFQPDIIVSLGEDFATSAVPLAEPAFASEPRYVFWQQDPSLQDLVNTSNLSSRSRGPLLPDPAISGGERHDAFTIRFLAELGTSPSPAAAYYYDAAYLLFLAAAGQGEVPTGAQLSARFASFAGSGPLVDVGPNDLNSGLALTASDAPMTPNGVSGRIAFDASTGSVLPIVEMWCLPPGDPNPFISSGQQFDVLDQSTIGSWSCP